MSIAWLFGQPIGAVESGGAVGSLNTEGEGVALMACAADQITVAQSFRLVSDCDLTFQSASERFLMWVPACMLRNI